MTTVTIIYTHSMYNAASPSLAFAAEGQAPIDDSGLDVHQDAHRHYLPAGFALGETNYGELLAWRGPWAYELAWNNRTKLPILREAGRTDGLGHAYTLASAE